MSESNSADQYTHDIEIPHYADVRSFVCVHEAFEVVLMALHQPDKTKAAAITMTYLRRPDFNSPWQLGADPKGNAEIYDFDFKQLVGANIPDYIEDLVTVTCHHLEDLEPTVLQTAASRMALRSKNARYIALERVDKARDTLRRRESDLEEFQQRHPLPDVATIEPAALAYCHVEMLSSELGPIRVEISDTKIIEFSTIGGGLVLPGTQAGEEFTATWDGEWDGGPENSHAEMVIEELLEVIRTQRKVHIAKAITTHVNRESHEIGLIKDAIDVTLDAIEQRHLEELMIVSEVHAKLDEITSEGPAVTP